MCTTQFHFKTYNTHLFYSDLVTDYANVIKNITAPGLGLPLVTPALFEDEPRRQAISKYLSTLEPKMINIAALQEVWWAQFAHELYTAAKDANSYVNRWCYADQGHGLNNPGLLILGDAQSGPFGDPPETSYKESCGEGLIPPWGSSAWDVQDLPVFKGRAHVTCPFKCSAGEAHTLLLFTTHMPVAYGKHTEKVSCSFNALADAVSRRRNDNSGSVTVLLGDLNMDYYEYLQWVAYKHGSAATEPHTLPDGNTGYQDAVLTTLGGAGLIDDAAQFDPEYKSDMSYNLITSNPNQNLTWQFINGDSANSSPQRIDYFMHADSVNGVDKLTVNSMSLNTGVTITYNGNPNYQGSDHYPLEITATISGPH
jgi:hypothetical protein